jgi:5-formyltetrahydrofolate cyclo-ligase
LDKVALRQQLRRKRAAIDASTAQHAAERAAQLLARTLWVKRAQHIAAYLDYGSELQTAPLIEYLLASGKQIYLPRVGVNGRMRFLRLGDRTPLRCNRHGITEPAGSRAARSLRRMDVVILPLLGFDQRGARLGTGGGYYDRALAFPRAFRKPLLVGYGYEQQKAASIPTEPWDIRLDAMVTEQSIYTFNR